MSEGITVEIDDALMVIMIDRPSVLNALDPAAHQALGAALDAFGGDDRLRVAMITGAGERSFCVGSDLKARMTSNRDIHPPTGFAGLTHRFDLEKPVITAVNGLAIGGGLEIVLASDLAIAADHAVFQLPETKVGLAAIGGGGLQRLARQISLKHAMDIILTGRRFDAEEARMMGLISRVVPGARLMAEAKAMAGAIIEGAPIATAASLHVAKASLSAPDLRSALVADYPVIERMFASEDAIEGQRAFNEKRKPRWKGH